MAFGLSGQPLKEAHATVPCLLACVDDVLWVCEAISQANVPTGCHGLSRKYSVPNCHTWPWRRFERETLAFRVSSGHGQLHRPK